MMKKKLIVTMMVMVLCVFAIGCSKGADESSGVKKDTKEDTTTEKEVVKVAISAANADWALEVVEDYKVVNPDVEIALIEVGGNDMSTKMTMMMQSEDTSPDVMAEDGFMVKADAAAGYLSPLDDYLTDWADFANFTPAVLENGRGADGKQYGIPYSTDVQGLWYNKKLMAEAGIAVPFEPKTWDDLIEAGKILKDYVGDSEFVPLGLYCSKAQGEATSMRTFQNLFFGTGGELYDFDQEKWIVDKANFSKVLDFINTVYNVEEIGGPIGVVAASSANDLFKSDYFKNDKIGMYISANGTLGEYTSAGKYAWPEALDTWAFANIPTIDGGGAKYTTISGGWTWVIPDKASNKDGAMDFIKFATNKENHLEFCARYNVLSVRSDITDDPAYTEREISVVKESTDMLEYTHFRPTVETYATVTSLYTDMVENVSMALTTPEEAIANFEADLNRAVGADAIIVK